MKLLKHCCNCPLLFNPLNNGRHFLTKNFFLIELKESTYEADTQKRVIGCLKVEKNLGNGRDDKGMKLLLVAKNFDGEKIDQSMILCLRHPSIRNFTKA
jgi:hypothetical protein